MFQRVTFSPKYFRAPKIAKKKKRNDTEAGYLAVFWQSLDCSILGVRMDTGKVDYGAEGTGNHFGGWFITFFLNPTVKSIIFGTHDN